MKKKANLGVESEEFGIPPNREYKLEKPCSRAYTLWGKARVYQ